MASRSKVQNLYHQARVTFSKKKGQRTDKGFSEEMEKLQKLVHSVTAEDFDLTPEVADKQWDFKPYVTDSPTSCMEVFECPDFSIGIFVIKPRMSIPLHDHPGMHGIMKVLFGSMTVTSYSKPTHNGLTPSSTFFTKVMSRTTYTSISEPCCLKPDKGNIHEIEASDEPVAFLDVLGPPYNPKQGRDCTYYYRETPSEPDELSDEDSIFLKPGSNPTWFTCIPLKYTGPRVDRSLNS